METALAHEMASKNLIDLGGKTTGSVKKSKRAQNLEAKIGNHNVTGVVEITIPQGVVLRMKPVTSVNKRDTWRKFAQIKRN